MIFVYVTNPRNIISPFHKKVISHKYLQNIYSNLNRTHENKIYENKIRLNSLNVLIFFFFIGETNLPSPPPRKKKNWPPVLFQLFQFTIAAHQIWEKHP